MKQIGYVIKEILDNIGDGILFVDRDYRIVFANRAISQLSRQEEKDVINQKCHYLFHQSPVPCHKKTPSIVCPHHEVFKTGKSISVTYSIVLSDGTEKIFDITASPIMNENGEVIQTIEILRDVTEKKKAEEIGKAMLDNVMMGISMISPKMEIIWLNETFKKWFPNIDVRRKPLCYQSFYSPPREKICNYCPTIKAFKTGEIHSSETDICADGKIYKVIATPVKDEKGNIAYVVETVEDITKHKQVENTLRESEEQYKSLVKTFPDAVTSTDLEGRITYVSQQTLELHGFESAEELLGRSAFELIIPEDHARAIENLQKTIKEGFVQNIQYTLLRKDGSRFLGELNASLIKNAKGEPVAFVGTTRDITNRKQAEEALKASEKKYRDLVDNTLVGAYKTNLKGNFIYANKALSAMLEFESPEEMMRHSAPKFYKNPKDREVLIENIVKTGGINKFEVELLTRTGKTKNVLLSATLEEDIISGMMMDITEKFELESTLKQRIKELEDFYEMAIGRELKMMELKEEIERLKEELKKYKNEI